MLISSVIETFLWSLSRNKHWYDWACLAHCSYLWAFEEGDRGSVLVWESFPSHHGGLAKWSWSGCGVMEPLCSMLYAIPVTAHFVAPAQFVAGNKMCTFNGTLCRTLHTLSPQRDNMCSRSRHILSPLREHRTNCGIYTMLPLVWCIASALRQAFPNWPWKLYCILIKEIVDSWNYLFIINYLPEDIINAPTLDTFKARLDKCWSGWKFICTKLDRST